MSQSVDELGPVDWLVVEFPGGSFDGSAASAIVDLVERGVIRVLDIVVLRKDANADVDSLEISDLDPDELGGFRQLGLANLLSTDDVSSISNAVQPGSSAACIVWENTWAVAVTSSIRRHGGVIAASGRIPTRALLASVEADMATFDLDVEGDEPAPALATERITRASVVGPTPVARTALSPATAAVIAHGINRRLRRRGGCG